MCPRGVEQLGGHDVFAHLADVLPGESRGFDTDTVLADGLDVFDHDYRIGAFRHHMTGIDKMNLRADCQLFGFGLAGPVGIRRIDGHAVHGGGMKVG